MNDRDRLAEDLETAFGIDGPMTYEADRLIALGWTRPDKPTERIPGACTECGHGMTGDDIALLLKDLDPPIDEERLARALIKTDRIEIVYGTFDMAATHVAKAYREDTDA